MAAQIPNISIRDLKRLSTAIGVVLFLIFAFFCFEIYFPANIFATETIDYTVEKGKSAAEIAKDLDALGLIRNDYFLKLYLGFSLKYHTLQAGKYHLSARLSAYQIAHKMVIGDTTKNRITIIEGWDIDDVAAYMEQKGFCSAEQFKLVASQDYSGQFDFLKERPKGATLEGYLFPDTYEVAEGDTCDDIIPLLLSNFKKKVGGLMSEINRQKKSVYDVITMAAVIEKEVRTDEDRKLVSGILWKRLSIGMALQVDATINYITGKGTKYTTASDRSIDSPYNTYKYPGLPKGPITNPGLSAITAAVYPESSPYWYYLSDGITHYSKTLDEHIRAKNLYLE